MDDVKRYGISDEGGEIIGSYRFRGIPQVGDVFDINGKGFYIVEFARRWISGYPVLVAREVKK